jgi:hypothetical protein
VESTPRAGSSIIKPGWSQAVLHPGSGVWLFLQRESGMCRLISMSICRLRTPQPPSPSPLLRLRTRGEGESRPVLLPLPVYVGEGSLRSKQGEGLDTVRRFLCQLGCVRDNLPKNQFGSPQVSPPTARESAKLQSGAVRRVTAPLRSEPHQNGICSSLSL